MKGNQGLEALAALCGGRPKAVDMAGGNTNSNASATGTASSTPIRTSPHTTAPTAAPQPASPVSATSVKTNQIIMRQVAERSIAEAASQGAVSLANANNGGNVSAQHQQHSAPTKAPVSIDSLVAPGSAGLGNLTTQQISQAIVASTNSQGGRLDPALTQSLLYPNTIRVAPTGAEAMGAASPVPTAPAPSNNILANTMQQLVIQQYLQAQANAQVQQQQQVQAQAAATAASTNGHSQAALLAMTLAAGNAGQPQHHFLPNAAPAPLSANTSTNSSTTATSSTTGKFILFWQFVYST